MIVEVTTLLRGSGIRNILLKGPVLARWLYENLEERPYVDCDLLVEPLAVPQAIAGLREIGFIAEPTSLIPGDIPLHATPLWRRENGSLVEIHHTLVGLDCPPDHCWSLLTQQTETMVLRGSIIEILAPPARALHVALHAAQHGPTVERAHADLGRALERVPLEVWKGAAELARRLGAEEAMAAGLCLTDKGRELSGELGFSAVSSPMVSLRARGAPSSAKALEHLRGTRGARAKIALAWRKSFPSAEFLRHWKPIATRGSLGLLVARAWRPFWLLAQVWPGTRAWIKARLDTRR